MVRRYRWTSGLRCVLRPATKEGGLLVKVGVNVVCEGREVCGDWVGCITLGAMMGRSESSDRRGMVEALTL